MARLFVAYEQQGETSGVAGVGEMLRRDRLEREEQRRYEIERKEREAAVERENRALALEERRVTVMEEDARFDRALKEAQDVRAEEQFQYTKERDEIEQGFRGRQIAVSEGSLALQRELAELEKDTTLDDELKRAKIAEIKAKIKEYEDGGQEFSQTQGTYVGTVEARLGQWTNKIGNMAPEARPNRDELIQKHEYYADLLARMRRSCPYRRRWICLLYRVHPEVIDPSPDVRLLRCRRALRLLEGLCGGTFRPVRRRVPYMAWKPRVCRCLRLVEGRARSLRLQLRNRLRSGSLGVCLQLRPVRKHPELLGSSVCVRSERLADPDG